MKIWLVSWQLRPPALIRDWLLDLFAGENPVAALMRAVGVSQCQLMRVRAFSFPRLSLIQGFWVVPRRLVTPKLTPGDPVKIARTTQ